MKNHSFRGVPVPLCLLTLLVGAAGGLVSCGTTETDPRKVSAWDLTGGSERLDRHLESRRATLRQMQSRADSLEQSLGERQGQLDEIEDELRDAKTKSDQAKAEVRATLRQVEEKREELADTKARVKELRKKAKRLESTLDDRRAKVRRQAEYQTEIDGLAQEVETLEESIESLMRIKAKYAIESSS